MLNAIIYLQGKPDLIDSAPDIFKMSAVMRDMEMMVERDVEEDTGEPMVTLTFTSKNRSSVTISFLLKELRIREEPKKDGREDDDGCPIYRDLNSMNKTINHIQELIVDTRQYMAHIWVNLNFLNDPDGNDPLEVGVIDSYDFVPGKLDWGPFEYSYCMYKNCVEETYKQLKAVEGEDEDDGGSDS